LPRWSFSEGGAFISGGEVELFIALKCAECRFFDIYIQGSKKIQLFRAESEIESGWKVRSPAKRVSVIKRISGPDRKVWTGTD
jgi:hypothetical protein